VKKIKLKFAALAILLVVAIAGVGVPDIRRTAVDRTEQTPQPSGQTYLEYFRNLDHSKTSLVDGSIQSGSLVDGSLDFGGWAVRIKSTGISNKYITIKFTPFDLSTRIFISGYFEQSSNIPLNRRLYIVYSDDSTSSFDIEINDGNSGFNTEFISNKLIKYFNLELWKNSWFLDPFPSNFEVNLNCVFFYYPQTNNNPTSYEPQITVDSGPGIFGITDPTAQIWARSYSYDPDFTTNTGIRGSRFGRGDSAPGASNLKLQYALLKNGSQIQTNEQTGINPYFTQTIFGFDYSNQWQSNDRLAVRWSAFDGLDWSPWYTSAEWTVPNPAPTITANVSNSIAVNYSRLLSDSILFSLSDYPNSVRSGAKFSASWRAGNGSWVPLQNYTNLDWNYLQNGFPAAIPLTFLHNATNPLTPGQYQLRLVATDGYGGSSENIINIYLNAEPLGFNSGQIPQKTVLAPEIRYKLNLTQNSEHLAAGNVITGYRILNASTNQFLNITESTVLPRYTQYNGSYIQFTLPSADWSALPVGNYTVQLFQQSAFANATANFTVQKLAGFNATINWSHNAIRYRESGVDFWVFNTTNPIFNISAQYQRLNSEIQSVRFYWSIDNYVELIGTAGFGWSNASSSTGGFNCTINPVALGIPISTTGANQFSLVIYDVYNAGTAISSLNNVWVDLYAPQFSSVSAPSKTRDPPTIGLNLFELFPISVQYHVANGSGILYTDLVHYNDNGSITGLPPSVFYTNSSIQFIINPSIWNGLANGWYTIQLVAIDVHGRSAEYYLYIERDDRLAQIGGLANGYTLGETVYAKNGSLITLSITPDFDQLSVTIGGQNVLTALQTTATTATGVLNLNGIANGPQILRIDAKRVGFHLWTTVEYLIIVDTVQPNLTIVSDFISPTARIVELNITESNLNNSARFNIGLYEFWKSVVAGPQLVDISAEIEFLEIGVALPITIAVWDLANNSRSVSKTLIRDQTAPTVNATLNGQPVSNGSVINANAIQINCADSQKLREVRVNGGEFVRSITGRSHSVQYGISTTEGNYSITIDLVDEAFNSATIRIWYIVDTTAPAITANPVSSALKFGKTAPTLAQFQISYSDANPDRVQFSISQLNKTLSVQYSDLNTAIRLWSDLPTGLHSLAITALDLAGNSRTISVNIAVDKTAPVITIYAPQPGTSVEGAKLSYNFTVSDSNLASVRVILNNKTFDLTGTGELYFGELDLEFIAAQNFTVIAVDQFGNWAEISVQFTRSDAPDWVRPNTLDFGTLFSNISPTVIILGAAAAIMGFSIAYAQKKSKSAGGIRAEDSGRLL
jgi:hypothetical protein